MTENNNPAQNPIYFMPQPPQNNDMFGGGLSGILVSILAGLILGQIGIGLPRIPKL